MSDRTSLADAAQFDLYREAVGMRAGAAIMAIAKSDIAETDREAGFVAAGFSFGVAFALSRPLDGLRVLAQLRDEIAETVNLSVEEQEHQTAVRETRLLALLARGGVLEMSQ